MRRESKFHRNLRIILIDMVSALRLPGTHECITGDYAASRIYAIAVLIDSLQCGEIGQTCGD